MKVRVFNRLILHERTKDDTLGAEFESTAGGVYDLSTREAYDLIGRGLAAELKGVRPKSVKK